MDENVLYRERRASIGITIILVAVSLMMILLLAAQLTLGPIGSRPAPTWVIAVLAVLFAILAVNFRRIIITITEKGITVRYGVFKTFRSWDDISECELDEKNYFYGWGIRFGRYKKNWVWIYNVIGGPRVAFITGKKKPRGLIVSTGRPDGILAAAGKQLARKK